MIFLLFLIDSLRNFAISLVFDEIMDLVNINFFFIFLNEECRSFFFFLNGFFIRDILLRYSRLKVYIYIWILIFEVLVF